MPRSPLALAALVAAAVPGLDVVGTAGPRRTSPDYEMGGAVDSSGRRWVVRCPLNEAAGAALEAELPVLKNLAAAVDAGRLPFAVPRPAGLVALPEGGRAVVWESLPGRELRLDQLTAGPGLSAELGRAIAALHELDPRLVEDAGLPVYDAESYRRRCLAEVDSAARTGHVPSALLNRWERALEDVALWRFRAVPVHGDLAPENVLVRDGTVTAMLDFTSMHVGDPAEDLAWLLASAPLEALDSIEEAYNLARTQSPDAALMDRAMLVSELAVARWLLHGTRLQDRPVVDDAVRMLRELADQVAGEPPIGHREPVVVPDWTAEEVDAPAAQDVDAEDDVDGSVAGPGAEDGAPDPGAEEPAVADAAPALPWETEEAPAAAPRTGASTEPGDAGAETDVPRGPQWRRLDDSTADLQLPDDLRDSPSR